MPLAQTRIAALTAAFAAFEANDPDTVIRLCAPFLMGDPLMGAPPMGAPPMGDPPMGDPQTNLLTGLAFGIQGAAGIAAVHLAIAAHARGTASHPIRDLIALLLRLDRPALIPASIDASLREANDTDPGLLHDLADYHYDSGEFAAAQTMLTRCLRIAPDHPAARNLWPMTEAALGRTQNAIAALRALPPLQPASWANLGLLLKDEGQYREAIAAYDTALALAPEDPRIRVNRVVALLRMGCWTEAWPDYEWRLRLTGHATRRPGLLPMLSTIPDLSGKTILAVHEDGFGDTLHFARYLPLLRQRGAHVIAVVPRPLHRILRGLTDVHDSETSWPEHDFYCPFFSLPRAFETTIETIPASIPYIDADPGLIAAWRDRLPAASLKIGLVWAGQARPLAQDFAILDGRRSLALAGLAPLADVPGVTFISLQHGPEAAQARTPPDGMRLFDPMPEVKDFADTAAIIAHLDLVISVDTAVAHLAGAMGKMVFLLDRYDHCWRWLSGRTDTPWYPSTRIFRQPAIGDWAPVLRDVATALHGLAAMRLVVS